jgi:hypothetical protein
MDLSSLILPSKTVEFDYEGVKGLKFSLAYLSKSELEKMRKDNTKFVKSKYTKQMEEELNQEAFLKEYIPAVLKGWEGLDTETIQHFVLVGDVEKNNIPYTEDNAYNLLTNSTDLDTWVSEKISEIENFRNSK